MLTYWERLKKFALQSEKEWVYHSYCLVLECWEVDKLCPSHCQNRIDEFDQTNTISFL